MTKTDTREYLVTVAQELIQARGYNAFSYQDLSERLDIKKASIHHHFPTKEDLGAEVIEKSRASFEEWSRSISSDLSASEKFDRFVERLGVWAKCRDKICVSGISSAEWNTIPAKMKEKVLSLHLLQKNWLVQLLESGKATGEVNPGLNSEEGATLVVASSRGALMVARCEENPDHYYSVMRQIKSILLKA